MGICLLSNIDEQCRTNVLILWHSMANTAIQVAVLLWYYLCAKYKYTHCMAIVGQCHTEVNIIMSKVSEQYGIQLLRITKAIQYNIDYIEESARRKASNTHGIGSTCWNSTGQQIEQIQRLLSHRDTLVYLQETVNSTVCSLPQSVRLLLKLVYVKKANKQQVAQYMGYSMRTLYRRLDSAKDILHRQLASNGITYQWLLDNVKPIADIMF